MSTLYVIAIVPAASHASAESAVAAYMQSPNAPGVSTFSVPLSPTGTAPATHYGACGPAHDTGSLVVALPGLKAAIPGSDYAIVPVSEYEYSTHWTGWLAARGLAPVVMPVSKSI